MVEPSKPPGDQLTVGNWEQFTDQDKKWEMVLNPFFQIVDAVNIVLATVAEIQLYKYWGVVKNGYFTVRLTVRVDPLPLYVDFS